MTTSGSRLGLAGAAQPGDRLLEAGPHAGVEALQRSLERLRRHGDVLLLDVVEAAGVLEDRVHAPVPHPVADRAHRVQRMLDVQLCARDHLAVVPGAGPAEVDAPQHGCQSRDRHRGLRAVTGLRSLPARALPETGPVHR